jgi:hypothetical protein
MIVAKSVPLSDGYSDTQNHTDDQPRKARMVSIRLDSKIIDEIQKEADNRHINFSVLINQILARYTEWDRYETKIGMMPVPKVILSRLIDVPISIAKDSGIKDIEHYRQQVIRHAAQLAFSHMQDSVLFMRKNFNLGIVLSVLKEYMEVSGIQADHKIEHPRKHIFVVQHDLGQNWSLFTKELLSLVFERLANVKTEIKMTPNTTVAEVTLSD